MGFLLLGLDSLIACLAIGPIVSRRSMVPLAVLFGVADGVGFLIGAGLHWQIPSDVSDILQTGILIALGLYLLVIAAFAKRVAARWPVWILPWALSIDNLTYGLTDDHASGSLVQQAGLQTVASGLLALVGLVIGVLVAAALPRMVPAMQRPAVVSGVAGGALILGAGVLLLAG
jgi:putative Mn2+ efflux pump MntP